MRQLDKEGDVWAWFLPGSQETHVTGLNPPQAVQSGGSCSELWNSPLLSLKAVTLHQSFPFWLWHSTSNAHCTWWILRGWGLLQGVGLNATSTVSALVKSMPTQYSLSLTPIHFPHNIYYDMRFLFASWFLAIYLKAETRSFNSPMCASDQCNAWCDKRLNSWI